LLMKVLRPRIISNLRPDIRLSQITRTASNDS
jgi:hypothetical protein